MPNLQTSKCDLNKYVTPVLCMCEREIQTERDTILEGRSRYSMLPSLVTPVTLGLKSFASKYLVKTCKTFFSYYFTNE